ncbi:MAG TPA: M48 family metallopeptidase [Janthinobacterium sp.]|nr:M48 family metallopeptidase [Janthinobacterium sp.]
MENTAALRDPAPFSTPGNIRTDANENFLFSVLAALSVLFWSVLTLATLGTIWLILAGVYLFSLMAMSYFISHLQGNGVKVSPAQFPALHARFNDCCQRVGLQQRPEFYLLAGHGALNAFATRFLRRHYVVLLSDIVDALQDDAEALNFYIGHELGHVSQKHLVHRWWIGIMMATPLLGAAYARSREYTCDQFGLACCANTGSAVRALAVLAAGSRRWKELNADAYIGQAAGSGGFWMSLNELTGDYPWLCKRVARVRDGDQALFPRRHVLACGLAALIPRTGFGIIGALVLYAYIGILAGSMRPWYANYVESKQVAESRASLSSGYQIGKAAADLVAAYLEKKKRLPASVQEAGFDLGSNGVVEAIDVASDQSGTLIVRMAAPNQGWSLYLVPQFDDGKLVWRCSGGERVAVKLLPSQCQPGPDEDSDGAEAPRSAG